MCLLVQGRPSQETKNEHVLIDEVKDKVHIHTHENPCKRLNVHLKFTLIIISCRGIFKLPLAELKEVTSISKATAYCVVMSTKEKHK